MTANEMKDSFLLYYDKLFADGAPALDDRQVSTILTKSQLRVFRKNYIPKDNKFGEGFEFTEQKRRNLEQFLNSGSISGGEILVSATQTGVHPQGTFYDLPEDFLYAIEEAAITGAVAGEVEVRPVAHDEYTKSIKNPYKQPREDVIWRMDFSRLDHGEDSADFTGRTKKRTEIIVEDKTTNPITDYRVRYLITPPDIVCDEFNTSNQRHCILDATLHYEIIDEAVNIAKAATQPEEYQISSMEKDNSEN